MFSSKEDQPIPTRSSVTDVVQRLVYGGGVLEKPHCHTASARKLADLCKTPSTIQKPQKRLLNSPRALSEKVSEKPARSGLSNFHVHP